jgi:multiple sugar transport system ATP-binding protein
MSEGALQQVGTPQALYDHPVNRFVAGFIGSPAMNFVELTAQADRLSDGQMTLPSPASLRDAIKNGEKYVVGFRPEHLELGEVGAAVGTVRGNADVVEYLGNEELLHVNAAGREIVAIVDSANRVRPGDVVDLKIPLEKLHMFDSSSGNAIEGRREAAAVA